MGCFIRNGARQIAVCLASSVAVVPKDLSANKRPVFGFFQDFLFLSCLLSKTIREVLPFSSMAEQICF
jgi:hypothetical protein